MLKYSSFFSDQCDKDFKVILRSGEGVLLILGILIHLHKLLKLLNFLGVSLAILESACNASRPRFDPWAGKIPWRRE